MKPTPTFSEIHDSEDALPCDEAITQVLLADFLAAKKALKNAEAVYNIRRLELLRLHHAGASIEPGKWTLTVQQSFQQILTRQKVAAVLGAVVCEQLVSLTEPTVSDRVAVIRSKSSAVQAPVLLDQSSDGCSGEMDQNSLQ